MIAVFAPPCLSWSAAPLAEPRGPRGRSLFTLRNRELAPTPGEHTYSPPSNAGDETGRAVVCRPGSSRTRQTSAATRPVHTPATAAPPTDTVHATASRLVFAIARDRGYRGQSSDTWAGSACFFDQCRTKSLLLSTRSAVALCDSSLVPRPAFFREMTLLVLDFTSITKANACTI